MASQMGGTCRGAFSFLFVGLFFIHVLPVLDQSRFLLQHILCRPRWEDKSCSWDFWGRGCYPATNRARALILFLLASDVKTPSELKKAEKKAKEKKKKADSDDEDEPKKKVLWLS